MGNSRNITADLVDWSETGLSVTLVAPIKSGTIIQVRGKLGDERVEISRRASILWCTEDPKGGYRMGLEFLDIQSGSGGIRANTRINIQTISRTSSRTTLRPISTIWIFTRSCN